MGDNMFLTSLMAYDSKAKSNTAFVASLVTGTTSIVLNLLSFGTIGSIFGLVSTISMAIGAYYKGKDDVESNPENISSEDAGFFDNDFKKSKAALAFTIGVTIISHCLNLFSFGIAGTIFDLLVTAGVGAFAYYQGKISEAKEIDVPKPV